MKRRWQRELDNADLAGIHFRDMSDMGPVCGAFNIPEQALTSIAVFVSCGRCRNVLDERAEANTL